MTLDGSPSARLTRLFRPESIAVIGGGFAELVANQCDGLGFEGQIWPVHPKRSEMAGRRCFPSVADLPSARVSAIGLYIEGVDDTRALDEVAHRAHEVKKPIVALKVGACRQSNRIALRHTASVTGSFEVFHAFCSRVGIAHVRSLAEFIETLNLVSVIGPLKGNRISSMSASGGEASLIADAAIGRDLEYPQMEQQHHDEVQSTLPGLVVVSNPFDYHTFTWGDRPRMTRTYQAMLGGGFDLSLLVLDWPREDRCDAESYHVAVESWIAAVEETGAPTAVMASFHEGLTESVSSKLHAAGVATLRGMTEGLAAVEAAWHLGRTHRGNLPAKLLAGGRPPDGNEGRLMDRPSANETLAGEGITTPRGRIATSADEAVRAAEGLRYPVVIKLVDPSKAAPSPGAGVYGTFHSAAGVRDAVTAPGGADGPLLVEEVITDGVARVVARIQADPQFGFFVAIRSGGELAKISDDEQILLLPVDRDEAEQAIGRLRTAPVLQGLNGRPAGDIDGLVSCLLALAKFTEANKSRLVRLEISPLIVRPRGLGTVAADALVRWR